DALGNLRSATLPNGTVLEYVIDPANRRVGKTVNGTLTQGFLYEDQLRIAAELDGTGNVVSRFVYGTRVNVPEYMVKGGVTYRLVTDHLGSPRLVINTDTGDVEQRMDYDEFGRVTMDTNPGFQPFGFAGGLYDRDTGLVRFGARDYDAATGRWTAKDPLTFFGSRGTNLYAYAGNDPENFVDRAGLSEDSVTKALEQAVARGDVEEIQTILEAAGQGLQRQASNAELRDALGELFRLKDRIPGGTAGAIRDELRQGLTKHLLKGRERLSQLQRLLREGGLCGTDRAIAEAVVMDLQAALGAL
ncbi:MAG TPA: RHS repeat-associated core domain-containing protein, partial [Candidatus Eisenbacteria bacterium]|nr:RHS repeat-associated core domain-containing protein [Candidatus Eisenbacteria bacterium]